MPEPNLPPLHIGMGLVERGCVNIDDLIKQIPELPGETRQRLQKENGLTIQQSFSIVVRFVNFSYTLSMFVSLFFSMIYICCNYLMVLIKQESSIRIHW